MCVLPLLSLSLSLESCRVMSRQVFYINPTDLNEAGELPLKAGCKGRRVGSPAVKRSWMIKTKCGALL